MMGIKGLYKTEKSWVAFMMHLWGTKVMYCYVVKLPVFRLQRGSVKSPLVPSSQDLLALAYNRKKWADS